MFNACLRAYIPKLQSLGRVVVALAVASDGRPTGGTDYVGVVVGVPF